MEATAATTSRIWGTPHTSLDSVRPRMLKVRAFAPNVKRALQTFLNDQIRDWQPHALLVVERSGTAILRALKESGQLDWPWSRVISSACLHQVSPQELSDRRILVFDDTMRSGEHLKAVLDKIDQHCLSVGVHCETRVAVFAVHEDGSKGFEWQGRMIPDTSFHRDLASGAYTSISEQIVELLQRSGSLMLDTEHIEVRLKLNQGIAQLSEALRRRADVVVFQSLGHRTNLTVLYPEDEAHSLNKDCFPAGAALTGVVRKCRVVQRQGNEFAIIPICYPSVPDGAKWPAADRPTFLREVSLSAGFSIFYAAALAAAQHVLGWALRDIGVAGSQLATIELPSSESSSDRGGYDLEHLRVMHPFLDVVELSNSIASLAARAASEGAGLRRIRHQPRSATRYTDKELRVAAVRLLQLIRLAIDDRQFDATQRSRGLFPSEIFDLGRSLGWQDIKTSTLFDILIDDAYLVPNVERIVLNGYETFVRTFEPDGELVSDLIRRFTTQWGLPRGY